MALQNTDYFLVNRGGTGYRLSWSELQTTTEASLQVQDVFTYTGTTGATTGAQTDVPLDIDQGIRLPVAGTGDYNVDGAIRYSPSNSKLEMYYAGAWNTASGGTAFGSTPPTPATEGDVWFDTDNGRSYVYYNDGSSSQWVEMNPSWNNGVPPDTIDTVELKDRSVTPAKLSGGALDYNSTGIGIGDVPQSGIPLTVRSSNNNNLVTAAYFIQASGDASYHQITKIQQRPDEGKVRFTVNNSSESISETMHFDVGSTTNALLVDSTGDVTVANDLTVGSNINLTADHSIAFGSNVDFGLSNDNWVRLDVGTTQGLLIQDNGVDNVAVEDTGIIRPITDNSGSIGTSSHSWGNLYTTNATVENTLNVRGAIDLADGDYIYMGSSDDVEISFNSNSWLYINNKGAGIIFQDAGTNKMRLEDQGAFRPEVTNTCTIGTTSHYWDNGYFQDFNVSGVINVRGAVDLGDNDVLRMGSGDDAELFCNGSHVYLDLNSGIGNFYIRDGSTTRFTFNDNGSLTCTGSITATSLNGTLSNTQVRTAIASSSVGAVGTYALMTTDQTSDKNPGSTVSNSYRFADAAGGITVAQYPNGTWRLMGRTAGQSTAYTEKQTSVRLRIA